MNNKKGFANIVLVIVIVILVGAVGYFAFVKKSEPVNNQPVVTNGTNNTDNQNNTISPSTSTNTEVKMKAYTFTTSANNQIKFQYPDTWTVGKFTHYPQQLTLQPSDTFKAEATNKAITMSITGHCMNTQCLTVFSLDDMVREQGLKVISTTKVKGATGYYVKTPDNGNAYVFVVGDDYITFSTDIYQTWLTKIVQTLEITQQTSWKDSTYNQFKNLANWKVEENISDWRLVDLDRSQLNKYSSGKIFYISKSFNEAGFPGPDVDQQMNQAASEQTALENSVKKALTDNGWKFVQGPTEGGFYHDYLYVKDNHPLILQIGTRNAVTGGMYVAVEFQY